MQFDIEKLPSQANRTFIEQEYIEQLIKQYYNFYYEECLKKLNVIPAYEDSKEDEEPTTSDSDDLYRDYHARYLYDSLLSIGPMGRVFDSGQPWMIYWITHSLELLDHPQYNSNTEQIQKGIVKFLSYCQSPTGGFCGGQYQLPHLASTYAAILAILTTENEGAYQIVDRKKMYDFLMRMRNPQLEGSFIMHENGECDMRATYIAIVVAHVLNILTDDLKKNVGNFISSCQTYEGGIGGGPFEEAHGGYTFCGFAALCCLKESDKLDLSRLLSWASQRQMPQEGGFNGRTNKVVDCCYSFWQCAIFKLLSNITDGKATYDSRLLYNQLSVQMYLLVCCQDEKFGGMRDKPGKMSDLYHTCYGLSGLSICQELIGKSDERLFFKGKQDNKLKQVDPIFNVEVGKLEKAMKYFHSLPKVV